MTDVKLHLYGTDWCTKSAFLRNYMQSLWIEFDDFNVETDATAEERVRALFSGQLKFPVITFGEDYVKNPSVTELQAFLKKNNLL